MSDGRLRLSLEGHDAGVSVTSCYLSGVRRVLVVNSRRTGGTVTDQEQLAARFEAQRPHLQRSRLRCSGRRPMPTTSSKWRGCGWRGPAMITSTICAGG